MTFTLCRRYRRTRDGGNGGQVNTSRAIERVVAKLFARGWLDGGREEAAIDLEAGRSRARH
jgi:hypothetical protein